MACFGVALVWLGGPGDRGLAPVLAVRQQPQSELPAAGLVLALVLACWWAAAGAPPVWVHLIAGFAVLLLGLRCLTAAIALASATRPDAGPRTDAPDSSATRAAVRAGTSPAASVGLASEGWPGASVGLASRGRPGAPVRLTPFSVPVTEPRIAAGGSFLRALPPWLAVGTLLTGAGLATGLPGASLAGALATLLAAFLLLFDLPDRWSRRIRGGGVRMLTSLLVVTLGTLWAGAGVGIGWPGGGATILALFLGFSVVAAGGVEITRQWTAAAQMSPRAGGGPG